MTDNYLPEVVSVIVDGNPGGPGDELGNIVEIRCADGRKIRYVDRTAPFFWNKSAKCRSSGNNKDAAVYDEIAGDLCVLFPNVW